MNSRIASLASLASLSLLVACVPPATKVAAAPPPEPLAIVEKFETHVTDGRTSDDGGEKVPPSVEVRAKFSRGRRPTLVLRRGETRVKTVRSESEYDLFAQIPLDAPGDYRVNLENEDGVIASRKGQMIMIVRSKTAMGRCACAPCAHVRFTDLRS